MGIAGAEPETPLPVDNVIKASESDDAGAGEGGDWAAVLQVRARSIGPESPTRTVRARRQAVVFRRWIGREIVEDDGAAGRRLDVCHRSFRQVSRECPQSIADHLDDGIRLVMEFSLYTGDQTARRIGQLA